MLTSGSKLKSRFTPAPGLKRDDPSSASISAEEPAEASVLSAADDYEHVQLVGAVRRQEHSLKHWPSAPYRSINLREGLGKTPAAGSSLTTASAICLP